MEGGASLVKKKWIALPVIIAIVSVSLGLVMALDLDNDKVIGWDEVFRFGSNPFVFDSIFVYANYYGINDDNIVKMCIPLEIGGLDKSEKEFIELVSSLEEPSKQRIVNFFLEDKQLISEEKKLIETINHLSESSQ
jgi:hypothetical protein